MPVLPEIEDSAIFVKPNEYTNLITGKRIRNRLAKEQVKVEYKPEHQFGKDLLIVTFHHPENIDSSVLEKIVDVVIGITSKVHLLEHHIGYEAVKANGS